MDDDVPEIASCASGLISTENGLRLGDSSLILGLSEDRSGCSWGAGRRAAGIGSPMPLASSAGRLSSTTVLPHVRIGTRFRPTGMQKRTAVIGPSKSVVAVKRLVHRPAGAVRDFRCPEGKATRQHSPCAARPTAAPTSLWWFRSGARSDPGRNCVGPQTRTSGLPSRLRVSGQLRGRRFPRVMPLRLKKRDVLLTPSRRSRSASRARSTWRNCEGYAS